MTVYTGTHTCTMYMYRYKHMYIHAHMYVYIEKTMIREGERFVLSRETELAGVRLTSNILRLS